MQSTRSGISTSVDMARMNRILSDNPSRRAACSPHRMLSSGSIA